MWSSSHTRFWLNQICGLFSRGTLLTFHVHPLSDVYPTVLYFYWSRTLLLNDVESLSSLISYWTRNISQVASFCWLGRRYCCCRCWSSCYKRTSNTLKTILSFILPRAFSLRSVYDGQKNPLAFRDLISTKSKIVPRLLFQAQRKYRCQILKLSQLRRRTWILSPLLMSLARKKFSRDVSIHPEIPHEITYICFLFSRLYQVHLYFYLGPI